MNQDPLSLPFSESCERNKRPILAVLLRELAGARCVLEIGSGTGQHAEFFAANLPGVEWIATELADNLPALKMRIGSHAAPNLLPPRPLAVADRRWVDSAVDAVFTANTLHIMSWANVQHFFSGVGRSLGTEGCLCVYGPFRFAGRSTSDSNEAFDEMLRARDAASGIRDFEALDELARAADLHLRADHAMPANNRLLVWRKSRAAGKQSPGSF